MAPHCLRRHFGEVGEDILLVGHGQVEALNADGFGGGDEFPYGSGGHGNGQIQRVLVKLPEHGVVEQRRQAVTDGIPDDAQEPCAVMILNLHGCSAFR